MAKMMIELKAHDKVEFKSTIINMSSSDEDIKRELKKLSLKDKLGIYTFFASPDDVHNIVAALKDFRTKQKGSGNNKISITKPNKEAESLEGCIYVGMVNKDCLYKRLSSHFFGGKKTGSLKLSHWFKNTKITELKLCYIEFNPSSRHLIRDYEKALWHYYKPCLGKL